MTRLDATELRAFLFGQKLSLFDPDSRASVATIIYGADGVCAATFADGTEDRGSFGLVDDTYWTRYNRFRGGQTHYFYLVQVAPRVAQAYHADGQRAFLQSPLSTLESEVF